MNGQEFATLNWQVHQLLSDTGAMENDRTHSAMAQPTALAVTTIEDRVLGLAKRERALRTTYETDAIYYGGDDMMRHRRAVRFNLDSVRDRVDEWLRLVDLLRSEYNYTRPQRTDEDAVEDHLSAEEMTRRVGAHYDTLSGLLCCQRMSAHDFDRLLQSGRLKEPDLLVQGQLDSGMRSHLYIGGYVNLHNLRERLVLRRYSSGRTTAVLFTAGASGNRFETSFSGNFSQSQCKALIESLDKLTTKLTQQESEPL